MDRQYTRLDGVRSILDGIIKDADAVRHTLRNPMEYLFFKSERIQQVLTELAE